MEKRDIAIRKFFNGYNCAQSVLYSFCEYLNFDKDIALKISCGFGAGLGRKQEVCGAVSGGVMVLSLLYGRGDNQDRSLTLDTYSKTSLLIDRFVEKQGTIMCKKLIAGCDLTTSAGQKEFKENLQDKVCKECVGNVVEILEEIIAENEN